jgi:hypothetical protein
VVGEGSPPGVRGDVARRIIAGPDDSMDWVVEEWADDGTDMRAIEVDRSSVADEVLGSAGAILGGRCWYDVAERLYDGVDGIYELDWRGRRVREQRLRDRGYYLHEASARAPTRKHAQVSSGPVPLTSPPHDQCGMRRPSGTSSAERS